MKYLSRNELEEIGERVIRAYRKLPELQGQPVYRIYPELLVGSLLKLLFPLQYGEKSCEPLCFRKDMGAKPVSDWEEWQSNVLGAAMLLPRHLVEYEPYILLDSSFLEAREEYIRNEKKFEWRNRIGHSFGTDEDFEQHHPECAIPDCAEIVLNRETIAVLKSAIEQLTPSQQKRLSNYFFDGKTYREIVMEEGASVSIVYRTIEAALKNLRKLLQQG